MPTYLKYSLILLIIGCAPTRKSCERNYGPCGFVEMSSDIIYRDTTIYLPGATISDTIIITDFDTLERKEFVIVKDSSGRVELIWYRDAYGKLVAKCRSTGDTVTITKYKTTVKEIRIKDKPATDFSLGTFFTILGVVVIAGALAVLTIWIVRMFQAKK